jgi:hypothetical protein
LWYIEAELEPDVAAADHDHALGQRLRRERLGRAPDVLAVEGEALHLDRRRAGRDHALARSVCVLRSPCRLDLDRVAATTSRSRDRFDLVVLEQPADATGELDDDAGLPATSLPTSSPGALT